MSDKNVNWKHIILLRRTNQPNERFLEGGLKKNLIELGTNYPSGNWEMVPLSKLE